MTLQPLLLKLARQGDACAIAVLMNAALHSQRIRVKTSLKGPCLQVLLKSPHPLDPHASIAFIRRGMVRLQADSIDSVRAYAWQVGHEFPTWIVEFPLCVAEPVIPLALAASSTVGEQPVTSPARAIAPFPTEVAAISKPSRLPASQVTKPPVPPIAPLPATTIKPAKPSFNLFKFGFVVVLFVMMYFVVVGV